MCNNKIRVVLVHPPISLEERFGDSKTFTGHMHPPQGLCHLASVLPPDRFEAFIVDAQALFWGLEQTVSRIVDLAPDFVGIMTFTVSVHTVSLLHNELTRLLPGVPVILGGPHISACPEETFRRYPAFSLGVLHEGELTLPGLLDCLMTGEDLSTVNGIVYRSGDKTIVTEPRPLIDNLDTLPSPRWDLLPYLPDHYRPSTMTYRALPAVAVVTSRGCPYGCIFCDRSVFGRKWRAHGPAVVLDWIDCLVSTFGIRDINFQDDHFMVDKERLMAICDGIASRHPGLLWSTIGRADAVDREAVRCMKAAGCWQIAFGIESGSQRILDILKKGETVEQIEQAVHVIKDEGMTVKGLFMAGCPTETLETLQETEQLIKRLGLDYVSVSAFTPTPNTEIFQEWEKYGVWEGATPDDWHALNLWEPVFIPHGLTKELLKQFIRRAPVV